jgi:hypothetical protein
MPTIGAVAQLGVVGLHTTALALLAFERVSHSSTASSHPNHSHAQPIGTPFASNIRNFMVIIRLLSGIER